MEDSILNSIKKLLGVIEECDSFDTDILFAINSTFSTLYQLGVKCEQRVVGPEETWDEFFSEEDTVGIDMIKSYTYMKVRIAFDPPSNSFVLDSINNQVAELEWRINLQAEGVFKDGDE